MGGDHADDDDPMLRWLRSLPLADSKANPETGTRWDPENRLRWDPRTNILVDPLWIDKIERIQRRYASGESMATIADEGVLEETVSFIVKSKLYGLTDVGRPENERYAELARKRAAALHRWPGVETDRKIIRALLERSRTVVELKALPDVPKSKDKIWRRLKPFRDKEVIELRGGKAGRTPGTLHVVKPEEAKKFLDLGFL